MRSLALVLLLVGILVLAGCGATMYRVPESSAGELLVRWERVSQGELEASCPNSAKVAASRRTALVGCQRWTWTAPPACTIYTRESVSAEVVGHEILHCFDVRVHAD